MMIAIISSGNIERTYEYLIINYYILTSFIVIYKLRPPSLRLNRQLIRIWKTI